MEEFKNDDIPLCFGDGVRFNQKNCDGFVLNIVTDRTFAELSAVLCYFTLLESKQKELSTTEKDLRLRLSSIAFKSSVKHLVVKEELFLDLSEDYYFFSLWERQYVLHEIKKIYDEKYQVLRQELIARAEEKEPLQSSSNQ